MIRVLVIDDVRATGEMIAIALRSKPDIEVVGPANNFEAIKAKSACCDVALVNAGRGGEWFLPLIRDINNLGRQVKIVVIGLAGVPAFVLQCVGAGVAGYTPPESSLDDLLRLLRAVYNNETLIAPPLLAITRSVGAGMTDNYRAASLQSEPRLLTRREREVLSLVQQGLTNLEIAQLLVIELGTVKNHVHSILRKLRINSRRDTLHLSRATRLGGWKEHNADPSWGASPLTGLDSPLYSNNMARATVNTTAE